jgi:hypothetical protein
MDLLSRANVRELAEVSDGPCVSLFLPTHRSGPQTQQDPIRFKNLLRQAQERLTKNGLRSTEANKVLGPANPLLDDRSFWQHQSDGLAVFASRGMFRYFRLPLQFPELVVVTDRFHIKPLLSLLSGDGRFYVLALSQNRVRLFQGTRQSIGEMDLDSVPKNLAEALGAEERERQLQFHTPGQRASAIYHGHGGSNDDSLHKKDLLRYFKKIDKGLQDLVCPERAPLVLAGVDYLLPIYREANSCAELVDEGIVGSPDGLSASELHTRAWAILGPHFAVAQERAAAQYRELAGTGRTSRDLTSIVPAAHHGRVDSLFVAVGVQQWGVFEAGAGGVLLHVDRQPGDQDLLDLAAVQTLVHAGNVYAVEPEQIPDSEVRGPVAAVFRY